MPRMTLKYNTALAIALQLELSTDGSPADLYRRLRKNGFFWNRESQEWLNFNEPSTPEQWQEAIDLANFFLHLDAARQYGLIQGGPEVNIERCEEILERGRVLGIEPAPGSLERITRIYAGGEAYDQKENPAG